MLNPISSFFLGLFCTGGLFLICLFSVVGAKMLYFSFKQRFFPKKPQPTPAPPPKKAVIKRQRKKPTTIPKPVRSIEIDPEQVDRIYVKKIS